MGNVVFLLINILNLINVRIVRVSAAYVFSMFFFKQLNGGVLWLSEHNIVILSHLQFMDISEFIILNSVYYMNHTK